MTSQSVYDTINKCTYTERMIQEHVDVGTLGLTLVDKEYETSLGRIDILTKDANGEHVPIEIKLGEAKDSAIGQILGYMKAVDAERGIIIAESFGKRVTAISEELGIDLMSYTIDITINCAPVADTDIVCDTDHDLCDGNANRISSTERKIASVVRYLKRHDGEATRRELLNVTKLRIEDFTSLIHPLIESNIITEDAGKDVGLITTIMYHLQNEDEANV